MNTNEKSTYWIDVGTDKAAKKTAGRHQLPDGMAKSSTTFRLPPDLKKWLIDESKRSGVSQANIVKNALLEHRKIRPLV